LLSSEEHTAYLNEEVFPELYYHFADEVISVFNLCIYLHRQSCLTEEINQHILNFKSNGLMQAWVAKFVDRKYLKENVVSEPKPMVNLQLLGAYEMLVAGLIFSISVFLFELLSFRKAKLRRIMGSE
jgi:hypothetical protein